MEAVEGSFTVIMGDKLSMTVDREDINDTKKVSSIDLGIPADQSPSHPKQN